MEITGAPSRNVITFTNSGLFWTNRKKGGRTVTVNCRQPRQPRFFSLVATKHVRILGIVFDMATANQRIAIRGAPDAL